MSLIEDQINAEAQPPADDGGAALTASIRKLFNQAFLYGEDAAPNWQETDSGVDTTNAALNGLTTKALWLLNSEVVDFLRIMKAAENMEPAEFKKYILGAVDKTIAILEKSKIEL